MPGFHFNPRPSEPETIRQRASTPRERRPENVKMFQMASEILPAIQKSRDIVPHENQGISTLRSKTSTSSMFQTTQLLVSRSLDNTLLSGLGRFGSGTTKFEQGAMVQNAASNFVAHILRASHVVNPLRDHDTDCWPVDRILFPS